MVPENERKTDTGVSCYLLELVKCFLTISDECFMKSVKEYQDRNIISMARILFNRSAVHVHQCLVVERKSLQRIAVE